MNSNAMYKISLSVLTTFIFSAVILAGAATASAGSSGDTGWFDTYESYAPETGWYDSYESYAPETAWYDTYESYAPETAWYDSYESYTPTTGWYDTYESYTPSTGWYDTYESYKPSVGCSLCGGGSYGGGGYSSGGGYSTGGGYSIPQITFSSPKYPSTPSHPTGSNSSNSSVTNTSVTNTSVTNIDNSIRDSFNNYNSNNTTVVATPIPAMPQYPIVYTPPVYTYPAPYCTIRQAQASGSGITAAYLSWTSSNATSAYLSNVGSVQINGSQTVWPTTSTTYVLTVYGQNGQSAQCQTVVYANSYPQAPYVALTQIPYTGFDFGTFGNAMYFAVLASFAAAAAYLAIYFKGGAIAFAGAMTPKRSYAPMVAPKAPILIEKEALLEATQPIVNMVRKSGTTDSMAIFQPKDGSMPRIVIDRS